MSLKQSTLEKWRLLIAEAENHPKSMRQYCLERGIPIQSLYSKRAEIRKSDVLLSQEECRNPFSRVEIVPVEHQLPDPKWVADFVRHLMAVRS